MDIKKYALASETYLMCYWLDFQNLPRTRAMFQDEQR